MTEPIMRRKKNLTEEEKRKVEAHRNKMWFWTSIGQHRKARYHFNEIFKITHEKK